MAEQILVVPSKLIQFTGMNRQVAEIGRLIADRGRFMDRDVAEKDEAWKQIIPYIVFSCGGKVLSYRRGAGGGESRLRELRSIGIGGHVNPIPGHSEATLTALNLGKEKELGEEVCVSSRVNSDRVVALINDNSTPVGRVHLGIMYLYQLTSPLVTSREPDKIQDIRWDTRGLLLDMHSAGDCVLESWSRIVLEASIQCET